VETAPAAVAKVSENQDFIGKDGQGIVDTDLGTFAAVRARVIVYNGNFYTKGILSLNMRFQKKVSVGSLHVTI
jgi:hypothetical protein